MRTDDNMPIAYQLDCLGLACSLGVGKQQVLSRLLEGDRSGIIQRTGYLQDPSVPIPVAEVAIDIESDAYKLPDSMGRYESRNNRLLMLAYEQIRTEAKSAIQQFGPERVAIVLGTSTSGVSETENAFTSRKATSMLPEGYDYHRQEFGDPAQFLAEFLGIEGPHYCISTACSSGAKVFGSARRLLETGRADAVIVGGVDSLCRLTINGFQALESISKEPCVPFEQARDGINIGEGAALFLMTRSVQIEPQELYLLGVGESSDAYHISAPHPEGVGAIAAMQAALRDAKLSPSDIAYINAHGTATQQNDLVESKAINQVFGADVPTCSTKGMLGHTLGAAGALEAAICWLLLSEYNAAACMPFQVISGLLDSELEPINLVTTPGIPLAEGAILSNSFAFGGSNAALVIGRGNYVR